MECRQKHITKVDLLGFEFEMYRRTVLRSSAPAGCTRRARHRAAWLSGRAGAVRRSGLIFFHAGLRHPGGKPTPRPWPSPPHGPTPRPFRSTAGRGSGPSHSRTGHSGSTLAAGRGISAARDPGSRQHFAGVGERDDQRMIAPDAVVGDVHAALHSPVVSTRVPSMSMVADRRSRPAARPRPLARTSLKTSSSVWTSSARKRLQKSPAVVGSGMRRGAQRVEEDFVLAAQFEILQTGAVAQRVVGEVEDMVGFVVGKVELEQMEPPSMASMSPLRRARR